MNFDGYMCKIAAPPAAKSNSWVLMIEDPQNRYSFEFSIFSGYYLWMNSTPMVFGPQWEETVHAASVMSISLK